MKLSCSRNTLPVLALIFSLAGASAALAQGKDPIIGTWILDRAKSEFVPENDSLQERTMVVEAVDNGLSVTTTTENIQRYTQQSKYTAKFDGSDAPIENSPLSTVSLKRVNPNTIERTGKIQGKPVESATMTVSGGGKMLTIVTKGNVDGQTYSSTQVFERK